MGGRAIVFSVHGDESSILIIGPSAYNFFACFHWPKTFLWRTWWG